jgi:hypothetical protein
MGRRGIEITSRRGVQLVALLFGVVALGSGYFLVTTGYGSPFFHCAPPLESPLAEIVGAVRGVIGLGLILAALRDLRGLRVEDPLLVGLVLLLAGSIALGGSTRTLVTGVAYWGRRGCLEIGAPLSYVFAAVGLVAATVAIFAAVVILLEGDSSDSDD